VRVRGRVSPRPLNRRLACIAAALVASATVRADGLDAPPTPGPVVASAVATPSARSASPTAAELRSTQDPALQRGLEAAVARLGLTGALAQRQLSVALVDVTDARKPRLAMLNGDEMMYAASLPKIGILVGALAEAESGRFPLDAERLGAMNRMIRKSSNSDATQVLKWVGEERLLQWLQSPRLKLYDAQHGGGLWVGKAYGSDAAYERDPVAHLSHGATAFQVARLYTMLAAGTLFQPQTNALMMDILSRPGIQHKFVRALAGLPDVRVFRKSGTWRDFHADSALVEAGGHRYVMVGLAHDARGGDWLVQLGQAMHGLIVGRDAAAATRQARGGGAPSSPSRAAAVRAVEADRG
jgi:beta-lactamase class A